MKYTIELVKTVELIVEAPSEAAAEKAASDRLEDDIIWDMASQDAYVFAYSGKTDADFSVDADGNEL